MTLTNLELIAEITNNTTAAAETVRTTPSIKNIITNVWGLGKETVGLTLEVANEGINVVRELSFLTVDGVKIATSVLTYTPAFLSGVSTGTTSSITGKDIDVLREEKKLLKTLTKAKRIEYIQRKYAITAKEYVDAIYKAFSEE